MFQALKNTKAVPFFKKWQPQGKARGNLGIVYHTSFIQTGEVKRVILSASLVASSGGPTKRMAQPVPA